MADINSLKEPYQKMATFDEKVNGSDKLTKQNKESIKNQNVTISKIDKSMNQDISLIDLKRKAKQLALKVNSLLIEVKTAGSPLLIRRDASLKSPVVGKLKNGTKVPIKKRTENWFKIEFNSGRFGWVNRKYAVVISDKENK